MRQDLPTVDLGSAPELAQLAEAVNASGTPRLLTSDGAVVAVMAPPPARSRARRSRVLTNDDPLLGLIGVGHSGLPGGASERKSPAAQAAG